MNCVQFVMFQFVCTHITSCVTLTHSDLVADEVSTENLQLIHHNHHPILVENSGIAPNYQPLLGPFCTYQILFITISMSLFWLTSICIYIFTLWLLDTDGGSLVDRDNNHIVTSRYQFTRKNGFFFWKTICRDVLRALLLMLNGWLEHHTSPAITTDSPVVVIKSTAVDQSTSPNSSNSFGKVKKNCLLCCWILVSKLLFDCRFDHSSQTLPAPFAKSVSDEIFRDSTRNRDVIVNYCLCHEFGLYGMYNLLFINLYTSN